MAISFATRAVNYFEDRADGGFAWTVAYDLAGSATALTASLRIDLVGANPGTVADIWETGAEDLWNRQFFFSDGNRLYEFVLDVAFVNSNAHQTVTVHDGVGRADMLNWYLEPEGWGVDFHDEIAAHEIGHMLGAFDEYAGGATFGNFTTSGTLMSDLSHVVVPGYLFGVEFFGEEESGVGLDAVVAVRHGDGADSFRGSDAMDGCYGGGGRDALWGRGGNDFLVGDAGNDRLNGGRGDDYARGGIGRDALKGEQGNDTLLGMDADDFLDGGNNADQLFGGNDNDLFWGGNGNDWMYGGQGIDTLYGGSGVDRLFGGGGGDEFHFAEFEQPAGDVVGDFVSGTDFILFVATTGDGSGLTGLLANQFRTGSGVTSAITTEHRFVYDTASGRLFFDADGVNGVGSVHVATFTGAPLVAASDIAWDAA